MGSSGFLFAHLILVPLPATPPSALLDSTGSKRLGQMQLSVLDRGRLPTGLGVRIISQVPKTRPCAPCCPLTYLFWSFPRFGLEGQLRGTRHLGHRYAEAERDSKQIQRVSSRFAGIAGQQVSRLPCRCIQSSPSTAAVWICTLPGPRIGTWGTQSHNPYYAITRSWD
jgi:hypothetical protein